MMRSEPIFGLICSAVLCSAAAIARGNPPEEVEEQVDPPVERKTLRKVPANPFERHIFSDVDPQVAREGIEQRLKVRLAEIDKVCKLTPQQRHKLELAGRLDINWLFDRIEMHRRKRKFEVERLNQVEAAARLRDLAPLQVGLYLSPNGIFFRERSLVHKTALTTLLPDQLQRYQQELEQRRLLMLSKVQKSTLKMLGQIDDDQRRELLEIWTQLPCVNAGPVDALVFSYQASQIPEEEYRKILDARQWEVLRNHFSNTRNYGSALRELGFIEAEEIAAAGDNP